MKKLFALLALSASLSAQAGDFLFQVPVKLDNIPKGIPQAKIICDVFTFEDDQNPIATGYTIKPLNRGHGSLHQEVDVNVNYHNMSRYMKPHHYKCQLLLLTPWAKPAWQIPGNESAIKVLQPKENSKLVTSVSGLFQ